MNEFEKKEIQINLAKRLQEYIKAIIERYGKYISKEKLSKLNNISDYRDVIKIYENGSVNAYANDFKISMPLCVDKLLNIVSKIPGYGINKDHKNYNSETLINNDNTFINYIIHVFVSGAGIEDYYEDMLLHETMHFCGSKGSSALKEGINELLTRKLALEKGFRTNACGYPKEVQLAIELQNIFGEEIINQIAFINSEKDIYFFLENALGQKEAELYINISQAMEKEFNKKYYANINSYGGFSGIIKKVLNYSKIDYSNAYDILNDYKTSIQTPKQSEIKKLTKK